MAAVVWVGSREGLGNSSLQRREERRQKAEERGNLDAEVPGLGATGN